MWHTGSGDRILSGRERSLFIHGAACLLEHLVDEARPETEDSLRSTGVDLFDRLDPKARIVQLGDVVKALTDPTIPMPELTAVNEAAVYAVFRFLQNVIEIEIDAEPENLAWKPELATPFILGEDPFYWRKLVLENYLEIREPDDEDDDEGDTNLDPTCADRDEWESKLECLADQILWDRDWEFDELKEIMDAPPESALAFKQHMGIDPDYFVAMPAVPDERQVQGAVAFIQRLAKEDQGDQKYTTVTIHIGHDGLVGLAFADPGPDQLPEFSTARGSQVAYAVQVTLPSLVAVDAAKMLQKIEQADQAGGRALEVTNAKERLNRALQPYLPETLQEKIRQLSTAPRRN